jgi:hypothetical protein
MDWLEQLIRTHLVRDSPQMGFRVPANRLRRLWTMLAHLQSETVNYSQLAGFLQELFDFLGKTTNEYCPYLFAPWDYSHRNTKKYGQTQLPSTYATGPRRLYSTKSFRNTGLNFRLNWPVMARHYRHMSQENLMST